MGHVLSLRRLVRALIGSCALFLASQLPAYAQTGTWTGAGGDSLWSNANNWNAATLPGCNNTAYAKFLAVPGSVNQDLPACSLNHIQLDGPLTFSGNAILLDGNGPLIEVFAGTTTFNNEVSFLTALPVFNTLGGNITLAGPMASGVNGLRKMNSGQLTITQTSGLGGAIDVQGGTLTLSQTSIDPTRQLYIDASATVNTGPAYWAFLGGQGHLNLTGTTEVETTFSTPFSGTITGIGGFHSSGVGMTLLGNNTFTGGITVSAGTLSIGDGVSGTFPAGPVTLQNGATLKLNATGTATITTFSATAGTAPTLVIDGGTASGGAGSWNLQNGSITVNGGTATAFSIGTNAGAFTVNSPGVLSFAGAFTPTLAGNGTISIGGNLIVNSAAPSTFAGVIAGAGSLTKNGADVLTLSGANTYTGATQVNAGTLVVTGSLPGAVTAGAGTVISGTGTIGGPTTLNSGAVLSPGLSPGILNTGSLNLANGSTLNVEIIGSTAGTGYDQVNVTGTVTLSTPSLVLSGAYVPVLGDKFIIIANDGADPVTGTFAGLPEGATSTFNGRLLKITYVDGGNDVALVPVTFNASSSANSGGTISPLGAQPVVSGDTTSFTITPSVGFSIAPTTGTCGGNLVGNIYTTNAVAADCTVIANFVLNSYAVTSSGSNANGSITPASQPVNHGSTAAFTVTPVAGYTASAGGTCPAGALVGTTYTTGVITGACNVSATFTLNSYTVTSSGSNANGSITPASQPVNHGSTAAFTVTPVTGYTALVGGTCPAGSLVGTTYTTGAITGACTVAATFTLNSYAVTSSGGNANGTITPASQPVTHGSTATFTVTPVAGYTASVGGTCPPGSLAGTTYTTGIITGACNAAATFSLNSYTVTANAGTNGTITPPSQTVAHGGTTTFTVTPSAGYTAVVAGTCPAGSLVGTTYTSGVITAGCSVSVTFTLNSYAVTSTGGSFGTITPASQPVNHGSTATFAVTAVNGYSAVVGGTCPSGTLVGTTYTTGPITGPCNVAASFPLATYTVTATAGANGSITPPSQTVAFGGTGTFTVTPNAGFAAVIGGTCATGSLAGTTYTTGLITAACAVTASFTATSVTTFSGSTATGTGNASASFTGGGPTCTYTLSQFIPLTGHAQSPPALAPAQFPHGLFDFALGSCTPGSAIVMTITYPSALPAGTQYWKYGPQPGNATPHWYVMPATITGNTAVFTITDGLQGDDDLAANGTIVDQGGPGGPPVGGGGGGAAGVPTLSEWAMMLLASLLLVAGLRREAARRL
jgi:autotransporter-associated beta strand protein